MKVKLEGVDTTLRSHIFQGNYTNIYPTADRGTLSPILFQFHHEHTFELWRQVKYTTVMTYAAEYGIHRPYASPGVRRT